MAQNSNGLPEELGRGASLSPVLDAETRMQTTCPLEMLAGVRAENPKDAIGSRKVPASVVPAPVIGELGLAMLEGALKYGRHNYRAIGVRASVYYDAARRHIDSWWEGEDLDPESKVGLSHLTKAIASLTVLRDAMINGKMCDDRPPPAPSGWLADLNVKTDEMLKQFPDPKPPYTKEPAK